MWMGTQMDGLHINHDTKLEPQIYILPEGVTIDVDNVTLDGNGATIIGSDTTRGQGIRVRGRKNVVIKNVRVLNYYHGISVQDSEDIEIRECLISETGKIASNTLFLDIWKPAAASYGSAIFLEQVTDAKIHGNDMQHQMNGLLSYKCRKLDVTDNNASYCSGFGFHLFETSDSTYTNNYADYCCRYYLSDTGSHLGADAAGFLIVHGSCNNIFRQNFARLGGDGFFLAGLTPDGADVGCNRNLFEDNDASYSPNNAFEGVFSKGNIYRRNKANHSNYGFWLGFSSDCILENNQVYNNRQAGIAVENGVQFRVAGNDIRNNTHGILLWNRSYEFLKTVPNMNITSSDWLIERNQLIQNRKGIRIAANQDHGIRKLPEGSARPYNHRIQNNEIRDNVMGIELENVEGTQMDQNISQNLVTEVNEK